MAQRSVVRRRSSLPALLALALLSSPFAQAILPDTPVSPGPRTTEIGTPVLENFSPRDYNSSGQIWTILQDRRGVMYFGNSGGTILEYDGVTWRKIFMPSSVTRSLAMDEAGKIWVGISENFGYLEVDASGTQHFVSLLDKVPVEDRKFTDVWQTLVTPQGVFFRSYDRLFRWDGKRMQVWSPQPQSRFQALSAVRGHIYTDQNGIGLQEIVGDELRNLPGGDAYKNAGKLFLHPYDETHILISQREQLLTLYDGQKVTPFPTQADEYLQKSKLYTSTVLADGSFCITTLNGGAVILGHDGKLRQIIDEAAGLLGSNTLSAYQDREGALWLGLDAGVARVEIDSPISIFSRIGVLDEARFKGTIYTSSGGGGAAVQRMISDTQTGRPSFVPLHGATQGFALLVFKDPTGKTPEQLLAATSEGVMKVEGDALVPALPSLHGLNEQTYFISQSHKTPSRVYIGHGDGVASMRWDGQTWIDEGRLPDTVYEARGLVEDADGALWVSGGNSRILRVEVAPTGMRDSKVQVLSLSEGVIEGSNDIESVAGEIFATFDRSKNMYRWDATAHKFVVDNRFLLPIDAPDASSALSPIDKNNFWSLTASSDNRRLGLFRRQLDGTWHVEEDPYRRLNRFRVVTQHSEAGGDVWMTGENLVRFRPGSNRVASQSFPTIVRQVNAGSKVVFGGTSVAGMPGLRLPPGNNALRFQFAALTYGNPAETDYQYLLEGADRDWSTWGRQKEANYSGLGPGDYRFRVRSRSDDGRGGEEGIYSFTILPPWYRTDRKSVV